MSLDLTMIRVLFTVAFLLAYLGGAAFYVLVQDRITYWTIGYWLTAAIIVALAPAVIGGIGAMLAG